MERDSESDSGDEGKLPFFSVFQREFRGWKEKLAEKVHSALEDEFDSFEGVQHVCCDAPDSSVCPTDSEDEDDVPLFNRLKTEKVDDDLSTDSRSTRSSRRGGKRAKKDTVSSTSGRPMADSEVVTLSSDDEVVEDVQSLVANNIQVLNTSSADLNETGSIDLTLDDEDEDTLVSVKINWMDLKMHRFELRKNQTFSTIFEELAKKENVPVDKILLILRDKIFISKDDSPESLNISVVDIIEGGITKEAHKNISNRKETDKNMMEFKCVLKDRKKPLVVYIRKSETMHCLMVKAAELLECSLDKLKFRFEGEELEGKTTPEELDLEGGEVIEVILKS